MKTNFYLDFLVFWKELVWNEAEVEVIRNWKWKDEVRITFKVT